MRLCLSKGAVLSLLALLPLLAVLLLAGPACRRASGEEMRLRVGLLPIIDSLPFYVAEEEGFFRREGLEVELVTFSSAVERDAALQAGQIDGQLADLIASGLLNKERPRIRIVKTTYRATPERAQISIIAAPGSDIRSPQDLVGARVAISHNTIIEYILDRLLTEAGVDPSRVQKVEVSRIPLRMEMLSKGQVDAAVLPEPLTTLAVQQGGRVILDDGQKRIGLSVLEFRTEVLKEKGEAVRRFLRAHRRAVEAINADPEKYRPLLAEKARLPEGLKQTFAVPRFPPWEVPSREDISQAVDWMVGKGLLPRALSYEDLVDSSFLEQ